MFTSILSSNQNTTDPVNPTNIDWDSLNTGDLILFHGQDYWFSYVVEWLSWSEFSHVAMILRDPVYLDPKLKGLYMLEAGAETFPDAITHRLVWGVQVVDLKKVIDTYTGKIYIKKVNMPKEFRNNMEFQLPTIWNQVQYRPYDDKLWDLFRTLFNVNWGDNERQNSYVCSALITFLYEQFGFFKTQIPWDLVLPKDYDDKGKVNNLLLQEISFCPKFIVKKT